ncbi:MAG: GldG family protein, partial [Synergistaceae bacterium]|nr:GldG family protein [Synergistaceae bacterium]
MAASDEITRKIEGDFWSGAAKTMASLTRKGGLWTVVMAAIVLACAILITLLAEESEERFGLHWDLTRNRVYSISEATRRALAILDREIVIYTVYQTGEEDMTISELLRRYEMSSRYVTVKNIDPLQSPLFTRQFEQDGGRIENNSIIVTKTGEEDAYRVVRAQNLYEWQLDDNRLYAIGLVAEQRVTSAILSLMGGSRPRV